MMHHRFNYHDIFQNKYYAQKIIVAILEIFEGPQMGLVFISGFASVNNAQDILNTNTTCSHSLSCMHSQCNGPLKTQAKQFGWGFHKTKCIDPNFSGQARSLTSPSYSL